MHISRGRRHFFFWKPCFVLFYFKLVFSLFLQCFELLWVMFSIYNLLLSLHYAYVLDIYTSLCHCALLVAYSDDYLLCYVIIVVISIWLFWYMTKLLICFTSYLLDRNLLVKLYLSFYYLLYLEGLMCFVQVLQVTGIYVLSSSQLLWFMIEGEREKELCAILTMFALLIVYNYA